MGGEIYIIVFLFVFLINLLVPRVKSKWMRRFLLFISLTILICFIGFRYDVGTDYDNYLRLYRRIKASTLEFAVSQKMEPLFGVLYWTFSKLFSIDYWIFFLHGILAVLPVYILNRIYGYKYLGYSVLIYCFLFLPFSLNGMRQGAAIGMILLAIVYLAEMKHWKAIISFFLATQLHRSAILVLPHLVVYYMCKKYKWNFAKLNLLLTIGVAFVVLFFLNDFLA